VSSLPLLREDGAPARFVDLGRQAIARVPLGGDGAGNWTARGFGARGLEIYELAIVNPLGSHARARNIVAVMLLGASVGATVRLEVDGPDEAVAMREIAALFHGGFGERS
jgi:hypothetical protein